MLKNFFVVSLVMMVACNSEANIEIVNDSEIETRSVFDSEQMLSFASEEEMFAEINRLKCMTQDESAQWKESHGGFVSQFDFMNAVVDELDGAASIEDVRAIQQKYSGRLLFSDNPEYEDIAPYLPTNHRGTELVCNHNGDVMIGGIVKNYNEITTCEESEEFRRIHNLQTRGAEQICGTSAATSDRKCWIDFYVENNEVVELKLSAHKKGLFGWNKYRTAYFLRLFNISSNWVVLLAGYIDITGVLPPAYYETATVPSGTFIPLVAGVESVGSYATIAVSGYSRGVGTDNVHNVGLKCHRAETAYLYNEDPDARTMRPY